MFSDESNVLLVGDAVAEERKDDGVADFSGVLRENDEGESLDAVPIENNEVDGLEAVFSNVDDVVDEKRLDGLFVDAPDKSELVELRVDGNERLEPCNKELLGRAVDFVDRSELVVDNNEVAVDGFFFESAIILVAHYCITQVKQCRNERREQQCSQYLKVNVSNARPK